VPADNEQRREERVPAALRLTLDRGIGVTENVSASGMFFETDASYAPGSAIRFTVDIETPGGKMLLSCAGDIVRVEQRQSRIGVAVRITESVIRPASVAAAAGSA
jgi:hypothetical protein